MTPFCHLTLCSEPFACIGSRCSAWMPVSHRAGGRGCCGLVPDPDDRGPCWPDPEAAIPEETP